MKIMWKCQVCGHEWFTAQVDTACICGAMAWAPRSWLDVCGDVIDTPSIKDEPK